jgi:hypothetical protein
MGKFIFAVFVVYIAALIFSVEFRNIANCAYQYTIVAANDACEEAYGIRPYREN